MKVVVPCTWVDDFLGVVSWPPKGKKTVGEYIALWAAPEKNWTTYEIVKTLLESGTTEEPNQVLKSSAEEDSSNEDSKFLAHGSILFFFFNLKTLKFFFIHCDLAKWFFCTTKSTMLLGHYTFPSF